MFFSVPSEADSRYMSESNHPGPIVDMTSSDMTLGINARLARLLTAAVDRSGKSRREVARAAGMNKDTFLRILRGDKAVTLDSFTAEILAAVEPASMVGGRTSDFGAIPRPLHVETDYSFGGSMDAGVDGPAVVNSICDGNESEILQ